MGISELAPLRMIIWDRQAECANQRAKGLELVGGVRGEATQGDIVLEAGLQGFEGLVRPETVTNQHPGFLVSLSSRLGIKHALEPLQADCGVGVARFGQRIVPSRGGGRASMGSGWPDDHW